jgi:hypothetical protein
MMKKRISDSLTWFWDAIDISSNLSRAKKYMITEIDTGLFSWVYIAAFIILGIGAGIFTWYFDLDSTLNATANFRSMVIEGIPGAEMEWSIYLAIVLTIMPTLMELFTAMFVKAKIAIVQVATISLCVFDAVTDMPRVASFLGGYQKYFDNILPGWPDPIEFIVGRIVYAVVYAIWLFMATFGFELLTCLFIFSAIFLLLRELFNTTVSTNTGGGNRFNR